MGRGAFEVYWFIQIAKKEFFIKFNALKFASGTNIVHTNSNIKLISLNSNVNHTLL